MWKYFHLYVPPCDEHLLVSIDQNHAYGQSEQVITELKLAALHLNELPVDPVRACLRMLQVHIVLLCVGLSEGSLTIDSDMDAALFPLVDYLPVFIVVDLISLVVLDQIQEAVAAIQWFLGRVSGVEVKVFCLCRHIDRTLLLTRHFYTL